jgi:thiamine transport system substrate-binding protein
VHSPRPTVMRRLAVLGVLLAVLPTACGGDDDDDDATGDQITLMTHDSFNASEEVLAGFTDETGIEVEILRAGDAGAALNQAILTKDNPEADVFFGVDNTFLSRALDADLFVPHEADGLDRVDPAFVLDEEHRVTPIDYGDVCVNYDREYFTTNGLEPPATLEDLADPRYRDLLVVQNPATSSPGLAFLLATIDRFGSDGYLDYWSDLRANGVQVSDGWEDAYYGQFSGGSGEGSRPLVVSYASSPPAEVLGLDPPPAESPTAVVVDGCFRQIEFAGVLTGAANEEGARRFVDFLLSPEFQEDMPLSMFVFPVLTDAALPEVFVEHAVIPPEPAAVDPEEIGANRETWIADWTETVLR